MVEVLFHVSIKYPKDCTYSSIVNALNKDKLVFALGAIIPGLKNYEKNEKNDSFTAQCSPSVMEQTKIKLSSWGVTFLEDKKEGPAKEIVNLDELVARVMTRGMRCAPSGTECLGDSKVRIEFRPYILDGKVVVVFASIYTTFSDLRTTTLLLQVSLTMDDKLIKCDKAWEGILDNNKQLSICAKGSTLSFHPEDSVIVLKPEQSLINFSFNLPSSVFSSTKLFLTTTLTPEQNYPPTNNIPTIISFLSLLSSSLPPVSICMIEGMGCGKASFWNTFMMMDGNQSKNARFSEAPWTHKTFVNNFVIANEISRNLVVTDVSGYDFSQSFSVNELPSKPSFVVCASTARNLYCSKAMRDNKRFWDKFQNRSKTEFVVPENLEEFISFYKSLVKNMAKLNDTDTIHAATRVIILVTQVDMIPPRYRDSFHQLVKSQFITHGIPGNYVAFGTKTCQWDYSALDKHDTEIQEQLNFSDSLDQLESEWFSHDYGTHCVSPHCQHDYTPDTKDAFNRILRMIASADL